MNSLHQRFGGIARLYGNDMLELFARSHVAVIGLGGVGSWAVESLARSGIGKISKIDLDDICVTNTNRQIHALEGNFGRQKTEAMADRIKAINPDCEVIVRNAFYSKRNADHLLSEGYDCVIDSIDQIMEKAHLIANCVQREIPIISCGGTGGKRDPLKIKIDDFIDVTNDPLIHKIRTLLRTRYGFPKGTDNRKGMKKFGVSAIYSTENPVYPQCDGSVSSKREILTEDRTPMRLNCASGFGSATHMTASVGMFAAARALELIIEKYSKETGDDV